MFSGGQRLCAIRAGSLLLLQRGARSAAVVDLTTEHSAADLVSPCGGGAVDGCWVGDLALVGYDTGSVVFHRKNGLAVHHQRVHGSPVVAVAAGTDTSECASLHEDGVLCWVDPAAGPLLSAADGESAATLPYARVWSASPELSEGLPVSKYRVGDAARADPIRDLAFVRSVYRSALEPSASAPCVVVAGHPYSFCTFRLTGAESWADVAAKVAKMARDTATGAARVALELLRGEDAGGAGRPSDERPAAVVEPYPCRYLRDPDRRVHAVAVSRCGRRTATADSLGRVCIVDTGLGCIVAMLRGCRDAELSWAGSDGSLLLVHLPRRAVVELWAVRPTARLAARAISPGSTLFTDTPPGHVKPSHYVLGADGRLEQLLCRT